MKFLEIEQKFMEYFDRQMENLTIPHNIHADDCNCTRCQLTGPNEFTVYRVSSFMIRNDILDQEKEVTEGFLMEITENLKETWRRNIWLPWSLHYQFHKHIDRFEIRFFKVRH